MSDAFRIARSALLVAIGYFRTNALFAVIMQQKYCDQGRSIMLLTTTCATCFARSSCGCGGKPRKPSTFPSANSCIDSATGCVTQLISFRGSSPTNATILERNTCAGSPSDDTATLFPF